MSKTSIYIFIATLFAYILTFNSLAEEDLEPGTQQESPISSGNFEIIIRDSAGEKLTEWTGQIFSIRDGQIVSDISASQRYAELPQGNYVLMLNFQKDIAELKGHRPFTFTIKPENKAIFTLTIGASQVPDMEEGIIRTVKGEDYLHFPLPTREPELCKGKCEKDRNCGAYTYCYIPAEKKAYCYLIRGAGTPGSAAPQTECFSGVIQRADSPYQVHITTEKLSPEE